MDKKINWSVHKSVTAKRSLHRSPRLSIHSQAVMTKSSGCAITRAECLNVFTTLSRVYFAPKKNIVRSTTRNNKDAGGHRRRERCSVCTGLSWLKTYFSVSYLLPLVCVAGQWYVCLCFIWWCIVRTIVSQLSSCQALRLCWSIWKVAWHNLRRTWNS